VESAFVSATGASGAPHVVRLTETLVENDVLIEVCASEMGGLSTRKLAETHGVKCYAPDDFFVPPVSGTSVPGVIMVAPASVATLGNIVNGTGTNLLHRVADVGLKERKQLVILGCEMPYTLVHLKNVVAITEAGDTMISAAPAFDNHPVRTVENVAEFVVDRVCWTRRVWRGHEGTERWGP
jgi:flavin prenyltransferase